MILDHVLACNPRVAQIICRATLVRHVLQCQVLIVLHHIWNGLWFCNICGSHSKIDDK